MAGHSYWPNVRGKYYPPYGVARGCFILFIPYPEIFEIFEFLANSTEMGLLGYLTSRSPGPMYRGDYKGWWTICIHVPNFSDTKAAVMNFLRENDLEEFVERYQINYNANGYKVRQYQYINY